MLEDLQIGSVGVSIILSILLRMLYGTWEVSSRIKPWIAVALGMGLAFVVMVTTCPLSQCGLKMIVSYMVQGFMTGATATGLYEMTKAVK
jgi:hypothetical protein